VIDLLTNVAAAIDALGNDLQVARLSAPEGWRAGAAIVVRRTPNNLRRLTESRSHVDRAFPDTGSLWVAALTRQEAPMPMGRGLVWLTARGTHLYPTRLRLRRAG
jgi:hypothetical protein